MDRGALQITVHEITKRDKTEQKSQHISDRRLISKLRNSYNSNKLNLEKAEEPEIKLPTFAESEKKQGNSRKASTSVSLTTVKTLTVWVTTNCGKFLKRWEYQTILPASRETCLQVKKQPLQPDMEQ